MMDFTIKVDSDREACMEAIEDKRREFLYPHTSCNDDCKKRGKKQSASMSFDAAIIYLTSILGCGKLWVTDGIWKTVFPHCMFRMKVYSHNNYSRLILPVT